MPLNYKAPSIHRVNTSLVSDYPITRVGSLPVVPMTIYDYLRIATWGDSTADCGLGGNNSVCDIETASVAFPGSGYSESPLWQSVVTAAYWQPSIVVANGGFIGNTVQNMLDRSKLAWSATRKSMEDVAAKRPHVVLFHGASINDYLAMTSSTSQATIDAVVAKHIQMVRYFTNQGIIVVDSGCYGYSVASPNLTAVCAIIVQTNAALKAAALNDPLWRFIDTSGITHDGTGLYIPTMTSDGTHLSALGGYYIGKAEAAIIAEHYKVVGRSGNVLWDQQQDYANAVSNTPANCTLGYTGGVTTIQSQVCDASKLVVRVHATAQDALRMYLTTPQSKSLAKIKAWDGLAFECDYDIKDLQGNPLLGYGGGLRILLTNSADNSTTGPYILYDRYNSICTHNRWTRQFSTPVDASSLGATKTTIFGGPSYPAGDWIITFRPWRLVRYASATIMPGFIPVYSAGVPSTSTLTIVAGMPQRVALPEGSSFRAVWEGFGPFAYRQGDSTVTAVSTDARATVGYDQVIQRVGSSTHISVYGLGSGTLYLEGGNGA